MTDILTEQTRAEALAIIAAHMLGRPHQPIEERHAVALVEMLAEREREQ
jgi:hypothetical protein